MKSFFRYIRSMRFGLLLLGLIALCSVAGTVIPQGREIAWYALTYKSFHGVILLLGLHHIFTSWYFVVLLLLLSLNLVLCSLLRIRNVVKAVPGEIERTAGIPNSVHLSSCGVDSLHQYLRDLHCRPYSVGNATVYRKHSLGRYGTFITHFSILLTVIFGALALYTPTVTDQDCMPGESIVMPDGTEIQVLDFRISDETGRLDYQSHIQITLPNGRRSEVAELKVNYPFSFGSYKLFQQTFGTAGSIAVTDLETGGCDTFLLTEPSYLSADGITGIFYDTLYPDYIRNEDGEVTLITITEGSYPNPIYQVEAISDGVFTPTLAVPGDELTVEGLRFSFNEPVEYPGLRIKHVNPLVNAMLIASFVLMIIGLYLTFFYETILVKVDENGYAVAGPKPERMRIDLYDEFQKYELNGRT